MKKAEVLIGNVTKDVDIARIMCFLKQEAESMIGRNESDKTKKVVVEISVKEVVDIV